MGSIVVNGLKMFFKHFLGVRENISNNKIKKWGKLQNIVQ